MSWEYRIFYPITKGCFDIVGERKDDLSVTKRTDVYVALHEDIGVKLRSGKKMEMKTRVLLGSEKRERWEKSKMSSSFLDDDSIAKEVGLDDEERKDLAVKGQFCRVEISKRRLRFYLNGDTLCEQTDLEIKSISENFPGSKCNEKMKWRTICVEGSKKEVILGMKYLKETIPSSQKKIVMGYPEFVACLAFSRDPIKRFLSSS